MIKIEELTKADKGKFEGESMTKKQAKKLTLEVWRYLAKHPEIGRKPNLPVKLYVKIKRLENECPLCEALPDGCKCEDWCPLKGCVTEKDDAFVKWVFGNENQRKIAAQKIVDAVEAWEV